jgi:hypothetical protein
MSPRTRARIAAVVVVVFGPVGCVTADARVIEAADSLVPPESEVTQVVEEPTGLISAVAYEITDGGLGRDLVEAVAVQAQAEGWEATGRRLSAEGVVLEFVREDIEAVVSVWTDRDPVSASIQVSGTSS